MPPERLSSREQRHRLKVAAIFAVAILAGLGLGMFTTRADLSDLPRWALPAVAGGVLALAFALTIYYWRQLDEMARSAHLEAFFWGGFGGMSVALTAAVGLYAYRDLIDRQGGSVASGTALGLYGGMLCIIVGYGLAWVFWWLKRR